MALKSGQSGHLTDYLLGLDYKRIYKTVFSIYSTVFFFSLSVPTQNALFTS